MTGPPGAGHIAGHWSGGVEYKADAVQAMAFACWLGAVVENMTQMASAPAAMHLGAHAQNAAIRLGAHSIRQ